MEFSVISIQTYVLIILLTEKLVTIVFFTYLLSIKSFAKLLSFVKWENILWEITFLVTTYLSFFLLWMQFLKNILKCWFLLLIAFVFNEKSNIKLWESTLTINIGVI